MTDAMKTLHTILDAGFGVELRRVEDRARGQTHPYRHVYAVDLLRTSDHGLVQGHGRDPDLVQAFDQALAQAKPEADRIERKKKVRLVVPKNVDLSRGRKLNAKNLERVPESPGVFLVKASRGIVTYVGAAKTSLRADLVEILRTGRVPYATFEYAVTPDPEKAAIALVQKHHDVHPSSNVSLP